MHVRLNINLYYWRILGYLFLKTEAFISVVIVYIFLQLTVQEHVMSVVYFKINYMDDTVVSVIDYFAS